MSGGGGGGGDGGAGSGGVCRGLVTVRWWWCRALLGVEWGWLGWWVWGCEGLGW